MVLLLTMMLGEASGNLSLTNTAPGEIKSHQAPMPVADDYNLVLNAPNQVPTWVPSQSSRLITPAKWRTSLSNTNNLRRNTNRMSAKVYTPVAVSGRLVLERMTAPLRNTHAVRFYVFELCRLLC